MVGCLTGFANVRIIAFSLPTVQCDNDRDHATTNAAPAGYVTLFVGFRSGHSKFA
jgi:hypothetical protein